MKVVSNCAIQLGYCASILLFLTTSRVITIPSYAPHVWFSLIYICIYICRLNKTGYINMGSVKSSLNLFIFDMNTISAMLDV